MKIYVGYILGDYATPLFVSANEEKVEKELEQLKSKFNRPRITWIEEYELEENNVIELNCNQRINPRPGEKP